MGWLVRDGDVLASLEEATSARDRLVGLIGRDGIEGALLLRPAWSVHTFGMRFAIDVAFVDAELIVLRTATLRPWRVSRPVLKARGVIEAEAGAFARWNLKPGDVLSLKG